MKSMPEGWLDLLGEKKITSHLLPKTSSDSIGGTNEKTLSNTWESAFILLNLELKGSNRNTYM